MIAQNGTEAPRILVCVIYNNKTYNLRVIKGHDVGCFIDMLKLRFRINNTNNLSIYYNNNLVDTKTYIDEISDCRDPLILHAKDNDIISKEDTNIPVKNTHTACIIC